MSNLSAMLFALAASSSPLPRSDGSKVKVKINPQFTKYFWGDVSKIAGKEITLVERNREGDCLCLVEGKGLVDVDHRDIER